MSDDFGYDYDQASEEASAKRTKAQQDAIDQESADFQSTFSTPAGERTLHAIYKYCRQMQGTWVTPDIDPNGRYMTYLEGRRSVILKIMAHLQRQDSEIIERVRDLAQKGA